MSTTMTAKNFQDPLLRVLSGLTAFKAGKAVRGEDTYAPVMALMGISDIDAYGKEPSSGQPMIQRWIQWACKNLRKTGQVELEGRGLWVLTQKGVQEAHVLVQGPVTTHQVPAPPVATPILVAQVAPPQMSRKYLDDPYILRLVLDQTPCLGHYSAHRGAECVTCPVTVECQNTLYTFYTRVAARFADVDAKTALPLPSTAAATITAAIKVEVALDNTNKNQGTPTPLALDMSSAQKITSFEETVCASCDEPITKGAQCIWVDDLTTGECRMLHPTCAGGVP